jgi:hypothetical protein
MRVLRSPPGQTRSFGDVGSMSGLPASGHGTCIGTAPTCRSGDRRLSPNETLWNVWRDHSGLMPANLTTFAHFSDSAAT